MNHLTKIVDQLRKNEIGIFPCDTILGLIGRMDLSVITRIHDLKKRPPESPFLVLIPNISFLTSLTDTLSPHAQKYMDHYWPGPLTLILNRHPDIPAELTAYKSTIGIRHPLFEPLNWVLNELNEPLISTSVNLSGHPPVHHFNAIPPEIRQSVDFIYDDIEPGLNKESSVVDCTQPEPIILRKGALFS